MATTRLLSMALAAALAACSAAGDDPGASPAAPAQARQVSAQAHTVAATAGASWRDRVAAEVAAYRADDPAGYAEIASLEPRQTRARFLRFTAEFTDPRATSVLLDRLASGREPVEVRAALAEALPRAGGVYADALSDLLDAETDPGVRAMLVSIARRADAGFALPVLRSGLGDAHPLVRAEAARAAAAHREGARLAGELTAALSDQSSEVRAEAARALGVRKVAGTREAIAALLGDGQAEVRLQALRALQRTDPIWLAGRAELGALSADADPRIARLAVEIREALAH